MGVAEEGRHGSTHAACSWSAGSRSSGVRPFALQLPRTDRVVIAGGGILGANIAYQLAKRGAPVTLLDRATPGTGATANSFAWINARKQPFPYFAPQPARHPGVALSCTRELGSELPVTWGGTVEWTASAERRGRAGRGGLAATETWGCPIHRIDTMQLRALEKHVVAGDVTSAVHAEIEGSADPVLATEAILARAVRAGAQVRHPVDVVGLDMANGRLRAVKTSAGDVEADVLVIACGPRRRVWRRWPASPCR